MAKRSHSEAMNDPLDAFAFKALLSGAVVGTIDRDSQRLSVTIEIVQAKALKAQALNELKNAMKTHSTSMETSETVATSHIVKAIAQDIKKATFHGDLAHRLAERLDAVTEITNGHYARVVIAAIAPLLLENKLASPHLTSSANPEAWFAREEQIATFLDELNLSMLERKRTELAELATRRRLQQDLWPRNVQYSTFNDLFQGVLDNYDFADAMFHLWIYHTQIRAWSSTYKGDKVPLAAIAYKLTKRVRQDLNAMTVVTM